MSSYSLEIVLQRDASEETEESRAHLASIVWARQENNNTPVVLLKSFRWNCIILFLISINLHASGKLHITIKNVALHKI